MENYVIKIVPPDQSGKRLDSVIAKLFPDFSRSKLKNWIDSGSVPKAPNPMVSKRLIIEKLEKLIEDIKNDELKPGNL